MPRKLTKRCAIYTRKSSEEGLELEYNSLHAQRDAAEAFIKSQKHEGWKVSKQAYDDGGISGGHMERPALQKMLDDLKAGQIDIVVVYKVDRLSRSLADFAQMMQLFDQHQVSFVSVTQQFNTSSSMGRLTLNVLLSFAQFEREVTGERIRDKIALSKKKGRWAGGVPPLGYDAQNGKLKINLDEAEVVKQCFKLYLGSSGLIATVNQLNRLGLRTKHFVSAKGRVYKAKPWIAKQLHRVLTQPIYHGMVQHKGKLFKGEHAAIIDNELWQQVQTKLQAQRPDFQESHLFSNTRTQPQHPLKGFVHTDEGFALTPTFTSKKIKQSDNTTARKRYRYYVSQDAISQGYGSSKIKTVNALILESTVQTMIAQTLPVLADHITHKKFSSEEVEKKLSRHARYLSSLEVHQSGFIRMIRQLAPKIILGSDSIHMHMKLKNIERLISMAPKQVHEQLRPMKEQLNINVDVRKNTVTLTTKVSLKYSRGKTELIDSATGKVLTPTRSAPNTTLIQVIVQAEFWRQQMIQNPTQSMTALMRPYKVQSNYIRRLINAAYLAPEIKRAIFQGTQPPKLQVQDLIQKHSMDWRVQKKKLGFEQ